MREGNEEKWLDLENIRKVDLTELHHYFLDVRVCEESKVKD